MTLEASIAEPIFSISFIVLKTFQKKCNTRTHCRAHLLLVKATEKYIMSLVFYQERQNIITFERCAFDHITCM
jgi:hypothetical protein